MHRLAVPAAVRRHDRRHPGLHRGDVAGQVQPPQLFLGDLRVALILPAERGAVGQEVFRARHDARGVDRAAGVDAVLEAAHRRRAQALGQLGHLAVAFISAAPALVARHGQARRERPVDAGAGDLARGDARRGLHDLRAARAAEADLVREDRRALEPAVAVDRVDAVDHRDPEARRQRLALVAVVHVDPGVGGVGPRQRVGAAQHRPDHQIVDLAPGVQRVLVDLGHLADLLVERHLSEQRLDVGRRHARGARRRYVGANGAAGAAGMHARRHQRGGGRAQKHAARGQRRGLGRSDETRRFWFQMVLGLGHRGGSSRGAARAKIRARRRRPRPRGDRETPARSRRSGVPLP